MQISQVLDTTSLRGLNSKQDLSETAVSKDKGLKNPSVVGKFKGVCA